MAIEWLAKAVIVVWMALGQTLGFFALLNLPLLAVFAVYRTRQLRLGDAFDRLVTTPTHAFLHYFCALIYGLLMPAFYFLTVRERDTLGQWELGPHTNSKWTIALGAVCMTWLLIRVLEGALSLRRIRFAYTPANWVMGLLSLGLALWFQAQALNHTYFPTDLRTPFDRGFETVFMGFIFPQSCFLGATLVYGFAYFESRFKIPPPITLKSSRWAYPLAAVGIAAVFAPFWLSIPRVTHDGAMALLEKHRDEIATIAAEAELDPKLIAGIIYVAHTRDHPRLTGDVLEEVQFRLMQTDEFVGLGPAHHQLNASIGLCQMRISTADQTVMFWRKFWSGFGNQPGFSPSGGSSPFIINDVDAGGEYWNRCRRVLGGASSGSWRGILDDPSHSIALASMMLVTFREHWEESGFPISDKPEILATLYNIGYERSFPKAHPKANDFGRRVLAWMQSPEAARLFGPEKGAARHEP